MSKNIAAALAAPFKPEELKNRPGRAGMTFTYADARAVAQRLDDVLGLEGWQFEVKVADSTRSVVHGTLIVVIEGKTTIRQDFGYPNSTQDDEPLKSAASDALRRCAAQLGVGRSLYSAEKVAGSVQVPPRVQTPLSVAPRAVSVDSVRETDAILMAKAAMVFVQGECPDHQIPWQLKPAGVSKAGKEYDAFWTCSGRSDGQFCKRKPSADWVNSQTAPAPTAVSEQSLEDLPF
jgi:hypothetical protein